MELVQWGSRPAGPSVRFDIDRLAGSRAVSRWEEQQLTEEKMCSISICDETVCDRPAIRRLIM